MATRREVWMTEDAANNLNPSQYIFPFRCTDTKPGVGRKMSMTTNRLIGISQINLDDGHNFNIL